jgi:hypothetical protein
MPRIALCNIARVPSPVMAVAAESWRTVAPPSRPSKGLPSRAVSRGAKARKERRGELPRLPRSRSVDLGAARGPNRLSEALRAPPRSSSLELPAASRQPRRMGEDRAVARAVPSYTTLRRYMKERGLTRAKRKRPAGAPHRAPGFLPRETRSFEVTHGHGLWHLETFTPTAVASLAEGRREEEHLLGAARRSLAPLLPSAVVRRRRAQRHRASESTPTRAQFVPPPPASQCHVQLREPVVAISHRRRHAQPIRGIRSACPSRSTPRTTTHWTGHGIVVVNGSPLELLSDVRFDARVQDAALPGATSGQAPASRCALGQSPRHSRRRLAEGGQGSHGEG